MKKIRNLLILSLCFLCVSIGTPMSVLGSDTINTTLTYSVTPFADNISWVFKVDEKDGKTYKRQFNHSTGQWVGDWILVG